MYNIKNDNYKFTKYVYTEIENNIYELHKKNIIILIENHNGIPQRTIMINKEELTKRFKYIIRRNKLEKLKEKINI